MLLVDHLDGVEEGVEFREGLAGGHDLDRDAFARLVDLSSAHELDTDAGHRGDVGVEVALVFALVERSAPAARFLGNGDLSASGGACSGGGLWGPGGPGVSLRLISPDGLRGSGGGQRLGGWPRWAGWLGVWHRVSEPV